MTSSWISSRPCPAVLRRRLAALDPAARHPSAARQPLRSSRAARSSRTCSSSSSSSSATAGRCPGRPTTCWSGSSRPTGTQIDPTEAALRGGGSPRRPWPGHRRDEARQRDRRGPRRRSRLLLHRLSPRARARARRWRTSAGPRRRFLEEVIARHPEGGGQAGGDRQLPGGLADHDDGRAPTRAAPGPSCSSARRCRTGPGSAARIPSATSAACSAAPGSPRWPATWERGVFDGAHLIANFESMNPANTYWKKLYNLYSKIDDRGAALPRLRDLVGQPGAAERRGDAVDRRQPLRRQQAVHRRAPGLGWDPDRPAERHLTDHRLLLLGRRHHSAPAGARLDHRPLRARERDRRRRSDHRLHDARLPSGTSASSSPARWPPRSTASSPSCMAMIDLCRRASTRR